MIDIVIRKASLRTTRTCLKRFSNMIDSIAIPEFEGFERLINDLISARIENLAHITA
jgi:hypothetical protein